VDLASEKYQKIGLGLGFLVFFRNQVPFETTPVDSIHKTITSLYSSIIRGLVPGETQTCDDQDLKLRLDLTDFTTHQADISKARPTANYAKPTIIILDNKIPVRLCKGFNI